MKRSPNCETLVNESEYFCGIALTPLGAAEQEHGIRPIQSAFGIKPDGQIPLHHRHNITICPPNLRLVESPTDSMLVFCSNGFYNHLKNKTERSVRNMRRLPHDLPMDGRAELQCAWSGHDFGVYAKGKGMERLRQLYSALKRLDAAIVVSDHRFSPRIRWQSLCILIASATPRAFWPGEADLVEVEAGA